MAILRWMTVMQCGVITSCFICLWAYSKVMQWNAYKWIYETEVLKKSKWKRKETDERWSGGDSPCGTFTSWSSFLSAVTDTHNMLWDTSFRCLCTHRHVCTLQESIGDIKKPIWRDNAWAYKVALLQKARRNLSNPSNSFKKWILRIM